MPYFGILVRCILAIPHIIILALLGLGMYVVIALGWIPILLLGRYPSWAISLFGGVLRYLARVQCYLMLLPVPYPPFSFS